MTVIVRCLSPCPSWARVRPTSTSLSIGALSKAGSRTASRRYPAAMDVDVDRWGQSVAFGTALASSALDGVLVGGWLATRELDDRPARRRRRRFLLSCAFSAQVATGELIWHAVVGNVHAVAADQRANRQYAVLGVVASVALSLTEKRVPRLLAGRGVTRPHRVFGAVVGVGYAGCTLPVHWGRARGRIESLRLLPPD